MYKVWKKELQDWVENALPQHEHSYTEKCIRDENGVHIGTFHVLSNGKCLDKDPHLKFPQKPPKKQQHDAAVTPAFRPSQLPGISMLQQVDGFNSTPNKEEMNDNGEMTEESSEDGERMEVLDDVNAPVLPRANKRIHFLLELSHVPYKHHLKVAFDEVKQDIAMLFPTLLPMTMSFEYIPLTKEHHRLIFNQAIEFGWMNQELSSVKHHLLTAAIQVISSSKGLIPESQQVAKETIKHEEPQLQQMYKEYYEKMAKMIQKGY